MPDMIDRLCWFGNENATGSIQGALPSDKTPHGNWRLGFVPNSYQEYRAPSGGAARLDVAHTIVCSVSVVLSCDSVYGALARNPTVRRIFWTDSCLRCQIPRRNAVKASRSTSITRTVTCSASSGTRLASYQLYHNLADRRLTWNSPGWPSHLAKSPSSRAAFASASCCMMARRKVTSAKITVPCRGCRISARSAPTVSPIRATSRHRSSNTKIAKSQRRSCGHSWASSGARHSAAENGRLDGDYVRNPTYIAAGAARPGPLATVGRS
jgi:hypothetical protein